LKVLVTTKFKVSAATEENSLPLEVGQEIITCPLVRILGTTKIDGGGKTSFTESGHGKLTLSRVERRRFCLLKCGGKNGGGRSVATATRGEKTMGSKRAKPKQYV